ncbi:MAG TPA: tetratricopeptide repeat protein [Candidatus Limnocylindrales bacterium]|nr:tetratricopeptide repeat protein [Candidatus Limnocylindrales bacterium]
MAERKPAPGPDPEPQPERSDRESAFELLRRGEALSRSRHHAQAAIVLERAARIEPGKGSILEPLGRAYHHSGQYELARETFEALLQVDPSAHWAHFALAESLRKLGRVPEARTHLRLACALSPSSELYRRALARLDTEPGGAASAPGGPARPRTGA